MPWNLTYLEEMNIVCIENIGEVSFADIKQQTEQALELVRECNSSACLSDCRKMTSKLTTLETHNLITLYNHLAVPHQVKIAVLVPEELTPSLEQDYQYYETVALNRFYKVKLFNAREDAVEWLTENTGDELH